MKFKIDKKQIGLQAAAGQKRGYNVIESDSVIGRIEPNLKIRFKIIKDDINEDGNSNCPWRWAIIKTPAFTDMNEAKAWTKANFAGISKIFKIYF